METVVPGGSQGTMQGGIRLVAQSPHCSLSQLLSGQEAQDYSLPECLVRVPLHGEHRSDRVVTEPAGTRACLSAPCHELRNPSQCASVHVSVVPPFPRNVWGKHGPMRPRAHALACWIWKGPCLGLMTQVCPCTLTLICSLLSE